MEFLEEPFYLISGFDKMEIQQQITDFLQESRYFPVHIGEIAKITGQRNNFLTPVLTDLVKNNELVQLEPEKYFHPANFVRMEEKIVNILRSYHKNYPYLEGMKKGDIRKALNNKKGQNNVHDSVFERSFEEVYSKGTIIASGCYYKLIDQSICQNSQYVTNCEKILNFFKCRQNLNRICLLSTLADNLKIDSRHLRNIVDELIKKGEIIRLENSMFIDREHLERLKEKTIDHIRKNGLLTTTEAKELFGTPRKTTVSILEYFDELGITQREVNNRILL